jgi:hypothetical protein
MNGNTSRPEGGHAGTAIEERRMQTPRKQRQREAKCQEWRRATDDWHVEEHERQGEEYPGRWGKLSPSKARYPHFSPESVASAA